MDSQLLTRLSVAVIAAEHQVTAAQELLREVATRLEGYTGVVERQRATVQQLEAAVVAGRAVLAQAGRLGSALEEAVAAQACVASALVGEVEHAVASYTEAHAQTPAGQPAGVTEEPAPEAEAPAQVGQPDPVLPPIAAAEATPTASSAEAGHGA